MEYMNFPQLLSTIPSGKVSICYLFVCNDDNVLDELYEEINKTLRLTIAYCLLNKCPSISLKEFIYILEYRSKVSKSPLNYQVIADELNASLPPTKIIDLKPLLAKKKEKNL